MKCNCGGIMQMKRLSYDTEAHVCILCGRDDLPRRTPTRSDNFAEPIVSVTIRACERPRTCPGCGRDGLIFSGKCGRCRWRAKRSRDLITGEPMKRRA